VNDRLRILHVIHSRAFAGVEQFVRRLAVAQAADHDVRVVGGDPTLMARPLELGGVRFRPSRNLVQVAHSVRTAASTVDVVNTHMTDADIAACIALFGTPDAPALVATRHFSQRRGSTGPGMPYRLVERRIDAEISISRAVAASIAVPSTVVHPGVDPVPARPDPDRQKVVLMAQRLQPEKHSHVGLRAFATSGLAASGWTLDIAGDGVERPQLEELAAALGIAPRVRFLGFRADVPALMDRAAMLLATSPYEHFGLTVLEAMAAALPVVATDSGGHAEMLAEVDGSALFPPDDAGTAARLMRTLAHDSAARHALGAAQRARQQAAFTLRTQAAGTEAVYRRAIATRRGRR
jgi:glycosyltransferase involved in cell wall biosynthesis